MHRIFTPGALGQRFVTEEVKLEHTPRNFTRNPYYPVVYVIEADAHTLSKATAERLLKERADMAPYADGADVGLPRGVGHWASCIQAIDPITRKAVTSTIHLEDNETALSCAAVVFESREWEVSHIPSQAQFEEHPG